MSTSRSMLICFLALAGGCTTNEPATNTPVQAAGQAQDCRPVATGAANLPNQQPVFAGQTRACAITSDVVFDVAVVARGLVHPWAVEPLPNGDLLVTERPGRMRVITAAGSVGEPITGLPAVDARGQGGLLDVELSPSFTADRTIYWSYAEPREGGNGTAVARGVLSADARSVSGVNVIYRAQPTYEGTMHFGSRVVFGPDGKLYITMGERSDAKMRHHAQRLDNHLGKIVRINPDGSAPGDNPFTGQAGAQPGIWTLGHRNVQAAAFDQQGRLWVVEHGPRGGDELNLIVKGGNYGWPLQTYGIEYAGGAIAGGAPAPPQFEQPRYYWDPVIAPSGAQFYTGSAFPAWRGNLFAGGMKQKALVRLRLEGDRVTGEQHLLTERGQRVRDVRQGPDGALYVVTDEDNGELWRITPRR